LKAEVEPGGLLENSLETKVISLSG